MAQPQLGVPDMQAVSWQHKAIQHSKYLLWQDQDYEQER